MKLKIAKMLLMSITILGSVNSWPTNANASDWPAGTTPASKAYDTIATESPTRNDVSAAVFTWFSGFDHQVSQSFFLDRLAADVPGFSMQYPGAPKIADANGFLNWYQGVIDSVHYNAHEIIRLKVTPAVAPQWNGTQLTWLSKESPKWNVALRVRWSAPGKTAAESSDLCIDQKWEVLESSSGVGFKTHTMVACVIPNVAGVDCKSDIPGCLE